MSAFKQKQEKHDSDKAESGGRCKLCMGVLALPKKKRKDFYEACLDRSISHDTVVAVLKDWGVTTSVSTVTYHRMGKDRYALHMETIKKATT